MLTPEIKVFPDPAAVAAEAAERVVRAAEQAVELRDAFSLVLAGGGTPRLLYERLASDDYRSQVPWAKVEVFFGDERAVPPDHPDSNHRMAREALLSKVPVPGDNVYRMKGELDPEQAAKEYGQMLKDRFGDAGPDLVLLGMGDDGHTLSLFPGTPAVDESKHRVVANYAEQSTTGKSWRITMTAPFVNRAQQVLMLVTGANKATRLAEVLEADPGEPPKYPVQLIRPESGRIAWLLDAAAAGM
jgi:6-phosphogluconolactonase